MLLWFNVLPFVQPVKKPEHLSFVHLPRPVITKESMMRPTFPTLTGSLPALVPPHPSRPRLGHVDSFPIEKPFVLLPSVYTIFATHSYTQELVVHYDNACDNVDSPCRAPGRFPFPFPVPHQSSH